MKRFGTKLRINLSHLKYNYHLLRTICPKQKIIFMVKANAYGHGALEITDYSYNILNIKEFGVASLGEALELRLGLPQRQFDVYVFSDLMFSDSKLIQKYSELRIIPVLSSINDLRIFLENDCFRNVPLVLKFDTGMKRLGITKESLPEVTDLLKHKNIRIINHLMTHFANSFLVDEQSMQKNNSQYQCFLSIKDHFKNNGISIENSSVSNSGAIDQGLGLGETHIRPGLMLYGPSSLREIRGQTSRWTGKNISSLSARIIKIFKVNQGDQIGYGSVQCPKNGVIVILAIGYGDGFSCRFKNPILQYLGVSSQIFGRINMDTTMLLIEKSLEDLPFNEGDDFPIWGFAQDEIINLSHQTDTIPYEHFCQLTDRIPRVYLQDES